jgi:hypothetical protein
VFGEDLSEKIRKYTKEDANRIIELWLAEYII